MEWHYDPRYGFKHESLSLTSAATYNRHAKSDERESVAQYKLFIECKTIFDVFYVHVFYLLDCFWLGVFLFFSIKILLYLILHKKK